MPQTFESWDLTIPALPPRSRLLPVAPLGVGTPHVESLTSYIARLAENHAVRVSDLAGYGLAPCAASDSPIVSIRARVYRMGSGFHPGTHAINGLAEDARRWVAATEAATCQTELKFLTLTPFRRIFTKQGLFRKHQAWCPACFETWRQNRQPIYIPLQWHLRLVQVCDVHRTLLCEACPHCGLSFGPLYVRARPGYCSRCEKWLGRPHASGTGLTDDLQTSLDMAHCIGDILAVMPQIETEDLRAILTDNLVRLVKEVADGSPSAFSGLVGTTPGVVGRWLSGEQVPRTDFLLRSCFRVGISAVELLRRDGTWRVPADVISAGMGAKKRVNWRDEPEHMKAVLRAALGENPPPSLNDVAVRLDYRTCAPLRRLDSGVCGLIAARYRTHRRRWYKDWAIRDKPCSGEEIEYILQDALQQSRPKPVSQIAVELGYASASRIRKHFPELCKAIAEKQRRNREDSRERILSGLERAIREQPPPTPAALARRLDTSQSMLCKLSPALFQLLRDAKGVWKKKDREATRLRIEAHFAQMKGSSVPNICRAANVKPWLLVTEFPSLYKEITAAYWARTDSQRQSRRDALRSEVRTAVAELSREHRTINMKAVIPLLGDQAAKDWKLIGREIASAVQELGTEVDWRA